MIGAKRRGPAGRLAVERGLLSPRRSFYHEAVRVVEEPVTDRIGEGGLPDVVVPLGGRQLARDDGRAAAVAVFEDLEEIAAFLVLHGGQAPVIEDEHV